VLINSKRPASKTEPLGDVLGRIPVAAVERIEVINGGASGIDMQGYPTIANVCSSRSIWWQPPPRCPAR
jgi:hypothetical protein